MRSTYFVDKETEEKANFTDHPDIEELDTRGFLGFAVVLFVIYALGSRPILYSEIGKWVSQIYRLGS